MTKNIWQTTNQQPWVEALASGLITCKTRIAKPHVPIGATVLLHSSKSRVWKPWKGLSWTRSMDVGSLDRGYVVAVARVKTCGPTPQVMRKGERKFWVVQEEEPYCGYCWDSAAPWTIRFENIVRLKKPVKVKGMLTPFAHAKADTIRRVFAANKEQLVNYPAFV